VHLLSPLPGFLHTAAPSAPSSPAAFTNPYQHQHQRPPNLDAYPYGYIHAHLYGKSIAHLHAHATKTKPPLPPTVTFTPVGPKNYWWWELLERAHGWTTPATSGHPA